MATSTDASIAFYFNDAKSTKHLVGPDGESYQMGNVSCRIFVESKSVF